MSKVIKPLLDENGEQVRRRLQKGDWFYIESIDKYECWTLKEISLMNTCVYYAEEWKPKENEHYYYYSVLVDQIYLSCYESYYLSDKINITIGNCFRTREEAEQADIQQILDNLKMYYKNKEAGK